MLKHRVRYAAPSSPSTSSSSSTASSSGVSSMHHQKHSRQHHALHASLLSIPSGSSSPRGSLSRSNSISSLSSLDSTLTDHEWGALKVYTCSITTYADYKTIRVSTGHTAHTVILTMIAKFKTSCRDPNLFELWMEVRTRRAAGDCVCSLLKLERDSRPLELQRCLPEGMSRFLLHMPSEGHLIRIHDDAIVPQSNYKCLMIADSTTADEALALLVQMSRLDTALCHSHHLAVATGQAEDLAIPGDAPLVALLSELPREATIAVRKNA